MTSGIGNGGPRYFNPHDNGGPHPSENFNIAASTPEERARVRAALAGENKENIPPVSLRI